MWTASLNRIQIADKIFYSVVSLTQGWVWKTKNKKPQGKKSGDTILSQKRDNIFRLLHHAKIPKKMEFPHSIWRQYFCLVVTRAQLWL